MEKINMKLFSTLKSLNRSIGNQIIDVTELYSPQKKSEAVEHEIIVKVKQRNKKYLENRKKKMLRSLELSPSELQLNDSVLDPNTTLSPSTKETQTLDDSKAPALNQLQTLNTNESLKQSINDKEQYRSMDVSLLPAVKGPIKPRLTLPGLRDTSVGRLNTLNKSESPAKNHISVLRSTKSTAHTSLILSFDKPSTINNPKPSPFSVSTRIIPKSLSVPRMRPVDHGVKGTRSLLVGKKIASYVIENCKGLTQGLQHNSIVPVSEQINNRKFLIDVYNNNIEMLSVSISKLDAAIKAIRSKFQIIDFVLSEFVSAGLHSHNIELHFSALRLQGKIQMKFSEFTKAITLYKTLRRIADFHIDTRNSNLLTESNSNCLRQKMFAYKRIAKCYQELQNYKLSIFYFIKMLQTAWLLKSADDELYIYDALGIQNYYLGDVKKSEFYHERAMKAILEPADSELRQLGIQKLLSNLIDVNNETLKKKRLRIKNIEADEEANEYPDSEDEFEMLNIIKMSLNLEGS